LDKYGIRPYQQFHYDKDETDKAIIMDVMEIVYTNSNIDGICIIGDDHIYGSVARRIREKGLYVLGIGTKNAATKFVDSCNSFVYLDNIEMKESELVPEKVETGKNEVDKLIIRAMNDVDDEIISLGSLGYILKKIDPAFDSRTYGYKKLLDLVKSLTKIITVTKDERIPPVYYVSKIQKGKK
jgi:hypothetical protein